MTDQELMKMAEQARQGAYAPYSHFCVGAALLCADGRVYTGCNIENATFTPTVCAERVALFKAVSEGVRDFVAIAVIGGPCGQAGGFCSPCGVCRQVMSEFCRDDFRILLGIPDQIQAYSLKDLLPASFSLNM